MEIKKGEEGYAKYVERRAQWEMTHIESKHITSNISHSCDVCGKICRYRHGLRLHNAAPAQIYIFTLYPGPKFTHEQIYLGPKFTHHRIYPRPKFT